MENNQLRENLRVDYPKGVYTLDLIRDGKRTATTRLEPLGEIGEQIVLYNSQNPNCEELLVEVINIEQLNIKTPAEAENWSLKEGWSVEHFMLNEQLRTKCQTTFKIVEVDNGDINASL